MAAGLAGLALGTVATSAQAAVFNFSVSGYDTRVQQSNIPGDFADPVADTGVLSGSFTTTSDDPSTVINSKAQLTSFTANWSGSSVDARFTPFTLSLANISGLSYNPSTGDFGFGTPILNSLLSSGGGDLVVNGLLMNALVPSSPTSSQTVIAGLPTNVSVTVVPEPTAIGGLLLAATAFGRWRNRSRVQA